MMKAVMAEAGGQDRRRQGRERAGPPQACAAGSGRPRHAVRAQRSTQLVRSAGVIGVATMTSRVLGLVRDQVLAYFFGAGDAMDAFRVAFRLPNLLRDLFAEGAMSAAFVPTFTRSARATARTAAWRLGVERHQRAARDHRRCRRRRASCSPSRWCGCTPSGFRDVPGKLELTIRLTRIMLPFLAMVAIGRGDDGDAQRAASLLHSGAVAGDVQRRHDRLRARRSCR